VNIMSIYSNDENYGEEYEYEAEFFNEDGEYQVEERIGWHRSYGDDDDNGDSYGGYGNDD